jgi:glycosyltransferase involved in cell wall biosynthesis
MKLQGKRVCVLSGNHLCHNPRVLKEADSLAKAGCQVTVLSASIDPILASRDAALMSSRSWNLQPVLDIASPSRAGRRARNFVRARTKTGRLAGEWLGLENLWQLGYTAPELLRAARRQGADLFIAHSEPALWAADRLRLLGERVGVDMEDWFSEDLLPQARRGRPLRLLRRLESNLLRGGRHRSATSLALSNALAGVYQCAPPAVVYNTFPWSEREGLDGAARDRVNSDDCSIHWFSQTIGAGRGLELLFAALPHLADPCAVHLRGHHNPETLAWVKQLTPRGWEGRIHLHDLVSNEELLSRIAEHDIGFAGDLCSPPSRDLTVTNKLFQYLLAGLAVIASDTAGHREVAARAPAAVSLYPSEDPRALAAGLNRLLASRIELSVARAAALRAAETLFSWERCEGALLESVAAGLDQP